jgi:hypothetical protein
MVAMEDAIARVGAAHGRGEQLPHVHGEGLEPCGAAAGCAGRGADAVDVSNLEYIVLAH